MVDGPYQPNLRDKIARWLANAALKIATPHYRMMISGAIRYGMSAAARDEVQGRPAPGNWEDPNVRARWANGENYR